MSLLQVSSRQSWPGERSHVWACRAGSCQDALMQAAQFTVQCQPSCQPSPSQPALPLPIVISAAEFLWVSFLVLSGSSQGTAEHGGFLLSVPLELNLGDSPQEVSPVMQFQTEKIASLLNLSNGPIAQLSRCVPIPKCQRCVRAEGRAEEAFWLCTCKLLPPALWRAALGARQSGQTCPKGSGTAASGTGNKPEDLGSDALTSQGGPGEEGASGQPCFCP
ncbi:uncharacterized protein LOC141933906 isoform X1 [Strix aluco]|uniref:uncharacterized protein LOC141933906 isoform X1 n=1 Tax=Strix aluco TaxID=111821 RepID=UPI003DA5B24C